MSKKYDFIGERIRKLRVLANVSQTELGKKLNLPKQSISRIEKGKRKVSQKELEAIASFLQVTPQYFLEDGWIENLFKKPYEPQNKWDIEVPEFFDDYLLAEEEEFDFLIDSGQISYAKYRIKLYSNIAKASLLMEKECKEKLKNLQ